MNRLVLWLLRSDLGPLVERGVAAVRYSARDGRSVVLPVQPVRHADELVVFVGRPEQKTWWRHFRRPAEVEVWTDGRWRPGVGVVETGEHSRAAAGHRLARPGVRSDQDATFVRIDLARSADQAPPLHGRRLTRLWFWIVTLAEFVGFAVPAVVGALTREAGTAVQVPALLAAGLVEGSLLGLGQASVLRLALVGLPRRLWIGATAAAASFAYGLGLLPSLVAESMAGRSPGLVAATIGLAGSALLLSIGTAQWLVLRRRVDRAARWIGATALAWLVGLAAFVAVTTPLWQPGQHPVLVVAIGLLGGLVMAATTSAITGRALRHLIG